MNPEQTDLLPLRDLLSKEHHSLATLIRDTAQEVETLFQDATTKAALLGFHLHVLKARLGERRGGDRKSKNIKGAEPAPLIPWKQLVEKISGRSYSTCRQYQNLATELAQENPGLSILLTVPLAELKPAERKALLGALSETVDGRTAARITQALAFADAAPAPTNNNPDGRNGSNNLPLSPDEEDQQLEFRALSTWFGTTEPSKAKPGTPAFLLMREAGQLTDPDGKLLEPEWLHLPREALQNLHPILDKLTKDISAHLRKQ